MTIELTPERALELLREVVAEYGEDHVYADPTGVQADAGSSAFCKYVDEDNERPSCLVGHVLFRAGVTISQLLDMDNSEDPAIGDVETDAFTMSPAARAVLRAAQRAQDCGSTWGAALAAAQRVA